MSNARKSARIWASRRSVFLVLSAITLIFFGIAQDDPVSQGLHELYKPGVAGGRLDNHLERPKIAEESDDLVGLLAVDGPASQDFSVLVHDADGDRLLVKVDADEVRCKAPELGKPGKSRKRPQSPPQAQGFCKPSRRPSPPSHSFRLIPGNITAEEPGEKVRDAAEIGLGVGLGPG